MHHCMWWPKRMQLQLTAGVTFSGLLTWGRVFVPTGSLYRTGCRLGPHMCLVSVWLMRVSLLHSPRTSPADKPACLLTISCHVPVVVCVDGKCTTWSCMPLGLATVGSAVLRSYTVAWHAGIDASSLLDVPFCDPNGRHVCVWHANAFGLGSSPHSSQVQVLHHSC